MFAVHKNMLFSVIKTPPKDPQLTQYTITIYYFVRTFVLAGFHVKVPLAPRVSCCCSFRPLHVVRSFVWVSFRFVHTPRHPVRSTATQTLRIVRPRMAPRKRTAAAAAPSAAHRALHSFVGRARNWDVSPAVVVVAVVRRNQMRMP